MKSMELETTHENLPSKEKYYLRDCDQMMSEHTNEHLIRLLRLMVDEQNQTELVLLNSLKQLKKSHLLLRSHGPISVETQQQYGVWCDLCYILLHFLMAINFKLSNPLAQFRFSLTLFQDLVTDIQCSKLRFRDNLVETNLDDLEDLVGGLYSSNADLEIGATAQTNDESMPSESKDGEDSEDDIKATPFASSGEGPENVGNTVGGNSTKQDLSEDNEEEEEDICTQVWRPPTPPKASPSQQDNDLQQLQNSDHATRNIDFNNSLNTPSPPQLSSVDMSAWKTNRKKECVPSCSPEAGGAQATESLNKDSFLNETFDISTAQNCLGMAMDSEPMDINSDNTKTADVVRTSDFPLADAAQSNECNVGTSINKAAENCYESSNINVSLNGSMSNESAADITVVLEEPTLAQNQIFTSAVEIPLVQATPKLFGPTANDSHSYRIDSDLSSGLNNEGSPLLPQREKPHADIKTERPAICENTDVSWPAPIPALNFLGTAVSKPTTDNHISNVLMSDRRGTFTLPPSSSNLNVAVVTPSTRTDFEMAKKSGIEEEVAATPTHIISQQNELRTNASRAFESSNSSNLSNRSLTSPSSRTQLPISRTRATSDSITPPPSKLSRTPNQKTAGPCSSGAGKRTLKRIGGPGSGSSMSTSNLLKSLGGIKTSAKLKTATSIPRTVGSSGQTASITSIPSYMAATTASARRFNLPHLDEQSSTSSTPSLPSMRAKHVVISPNPNRDLQSASSLVTKENEAPTAASTHNGIHTKLIG